MKVSIITPLYNEAENIEKLVNSIYNIFKGLNLSYEHILVDNCSNDNSVAIIEGLINQEKFPIILIKNKQNYGPDYSPYVGFSAATGTVLVPVVADFQDPLDEIKNLIYIYT